MKTQTRQYKKHYGMKRAAIIRECSVCKADLTAKPTLVNNFGHATKALRGPSYTKIVVTRHGIWRRRRPSSSACGDVELCVCSNCLNVDVAAMDNMRESSGLDKLRALAVMLMQEIGDDGYADAGEGI